MKNLASLLITLFFISNLSSAQDAVYKIEFISNWSSSTHPTDYPSGSAHWSPLIGATHKNASPFLQFGTQASNGVEEVAETGGTSIITQEINLLIATGNAYEIINGSGLSTGLGTITLNDIGVDKDFAYISLITMIAPSPDWVAQINNLKLTNGVNNWFPSISVDVYATDVGTDSGTTYTSANDNTNPPENIHSLENTLPFSDQIVGTFVFTLQEVLSVDENLLANSFSIYPNPTSGSVYFNNLNNINLQKVEIYTIDGKKVKIDNNVIIKNSIEIKSLKSGLYFMNIDSDKGSITKKLIIK